MESSGPPAATGKRLWHIVRAVFAMLRDGIAKRHLFSDLRLHLLLRQGKLAGKSIRSILADHSSVAGAGAAFSCRSMNPDTAIFAPREVEFSCSTTPFYAADRRRRRRRQYDAAAVARAFQILDSVSGDVGIVEDMPTPMPSVLATPAASVRPLRVTDSPFPAKEEVEEDAAGDREAEEFIRRFYEQLRRQQLRAW